MASWKEAPEVREIAERLIPKHHQHLELRMDEIRCVFRDQAAKSAGKTVLGKARKVGGLNCYLANVSPGTVNDFEDDDTPGDMFVLEIAFDVWEALEYPARVALVDHELCHFDMVETDTGELKRSVRPHDVEEFGEILKRHGLWRPELSKFVGQLQLRGV